jgi:CRP-like cAMP-binding protein
MKEQIKLYFNRYVLFSDVEIDEIYSKLESKIFLKQEFILQEGQICKNNYFIISGLVRSFYVDHKGKENITQFALENWWLTNMESFITQTRSHLSIQAIEKTQILLINKDALEKLYVSIPKLERFFRIITENMLIANQRRHDFYLQTKSKDRYNGFINFFPNFIQRVPQYMVASYLKITPEYLSELRKSK